MNENEIMFMRKAIELSRLGRDKPGTKPYGAVVVKDGQIIGEGVNRSVERLDPTSHGEIEAIREACRHQGSLDLTGCHLYTSCEPCSLCAATIQFTGISHLYYAASLAAAGNVLAKVMPNFEERFVRIREQTGAETHNRAMPAQQLLAADAVAVLREWANALDSKSS